MSEQDLYRLDLTNEELQITAAYIRKGLKSVPETDPEFDSAIASANHLINRLKTAQKVVPSKFETAVAQENQAAANGVVGGQANRATRRSVKRK